MILFIFKKSIAECILLKQSVSSSLSLSDRGAQCQVPQCIGVDIFVLKLPYQMTMCMYYQHLQVAFT